MIASPAFAGKRYAVLGLARSGAALVRALLASGASVTAWDSDEAKRDAILPELVSGRGAAGAAGGGGAGGDAPPPHFARSPSPSKLGEDLVLADPLTIDLAGFDGIVVSPGVPLNTHPIAAKARDAGVPVIGDIELFALARPSLPAHRVVGITGTNGKSTTTALVHHILATAGVPTTMGGNIGLPILGQEPLAPNENGVGVYVLELSSFQLDLTFSLDCDVAVLTNVTPDHLDRYDGFAAYAASKARLFAMSHGVAVIAIDDEETRRIASSLRHAGYADEKVVTTSGGDLAEPTQGDWPTLQGPHNAQNAAVAIATAQVLGIGGDVIDAALRTYPGLPHRMERVREVDGVLYVNDSKATNPTSTAPALAAYPRIHWILGGKRKTDELDACIPAYGHVAAAYTIGEAEALYATLMAQAGIPVTRSGTIERAVADAARAAQPGDTVLLSPACASYDQFSDYEARGRAFVAAVTALGETV